MRMDKVHQQIPDGARRRTVAGDRARITSLSSQRTCIVALLDQQGGTVRGLLTKAGVNVNLLRSQLGDVRRSAAQGRRGRAASCTSATIWASSSISPTSWRRSATTSTSRASCSCLRHWIAHRRWQVGAGASRRNGRRRDRKSRSMICEAVQQIDDPNAEDTRQALGEIHDRSDRTCRAGQARPDRRTRRRNSSHDSDPAAPHQEQPGADRRTGRRQDRHRRRARAAHRQQRGAGRTCAASASCR